MRIKITEVRTRFVTVDYNITSSEQRKQILRHWEEEAYENPRFFNEPGCEGEVKAEYVE